MSSTSAFIASFIAILVGAVTGLSGALFGSTLFRLVRAKWKCKSKLTLAWIALACGIALAGLFTIEQNASGTGLKIIDDFFAQVLN